MVKITTIVFLVIFSFFSVSCTDIGSFATSPGECYLGEIVEPSFVRSGFETDTTLGLTLNTKALANGVGDAGQIWTNDGKFRGTAIGQMASLANDSISLFQFPGGRIRNYLTYVRPLEGAPAIMVISLMEDHSIEVRIMRPTANPTDPTTSESQEELFGIFRLELQSDCALP